MCVCVENIVYFCASDVLKEISAHRYLTYPSNLLLFITEYVLPKCAYDKMTWHEILGEEGKQKNRYINF